MLALAHDTQVSFERIESLYGQLLQVSDQQLACVEHDWQDSDQFIERFQELAGKWLDLQAEIAVEERRLLEQVSVNERNATLAQKVGPIIRKAQENMTRAAEMMNHNIKATGSMLRSAQDHRQASRAYYNSGYEDHEPVFFDEKK